MLFITSKTYNPPSIETLRRWIKETFSERNLIQSLTPQSCRSASITKAFNISPDVLDTLGKTSWNNGKTFVTKSRF